MLPLLLACAPPPDATAPGTLPDLPTSACGGDAYAWRPLEGMGEVLDAEPVPEWSLDADAIAGLAGLAGLTDTSRVRYGARVFRVRYRTQDRGADADATMILAVPDAPGLTPPTVLYLHSTTGFDDFCAPSGRDVTWAGVPIGLAGMGYAVAAPDYLGQNGFGAEAEAWHPYLVAEATAVVSLDSVRALWSYAEADLGVAPSRTTVLLGASQGGGGALWAERYAPAYLPDAEIVGAVMSVPVFDLLGWADSASHSLSVASVGVPFALVTMNAWYGADASFDDVLQPGFLDRVTATMARECPRAEVPPDIDAVEDIYTDAWRAQVSAADLDAWAPWSCFLAESSVGTAPVPRTTAVPTLVLLGGADDVALVDVQRPAVDALCAEGEALVARECEGLGHTDTVKATLDEQVDWLEARLAGEEVPAVCGGVEVVACE